MNDELVFALFPLSILAFFVAERKTRGLRRMRRAARWQRLAPELGLAWHPKLRRMSGWWHGHYVGAWMDGSLTRVEVVLWPPLDLGLEARPTGIRAHEGSRARKLLGTDVARRLSEIQCNYLITDERVVLAAHEAQPASALRRMLHTASKLAGDIDAVRGELGVTREAERLTSDWEELARNLRLQMSSTPRGMQGTIRGLGVRVFLRRRGRQKWRVVAMAEFREPLCIGFRAEVRRRKVAEHWSLVPLKTGDPEFDSAFHVSAFESELVAQALSDAARARACELRQAWREVAIDDYGVLIEDAPEDAEQVERMLDNALSAAELVDFVHPNPQRRRAYR